MFSKLPEWVKDHALIWGSLGGLALVVYLAGGDEALAKAVYRPDMQDVWHRVAWWLREWGTWPGAVAAVVGLGVLFWPGLWAKYPLLYKSFAVLVVTAIVGAGLLNQVIVQELTDRDRPRESILHQDFENRGDFEGNSLPSGHAGMAFVLAAPFFVLRRAKPRIALAFMAGGLAWGWVVGGGRMVLGAHYFSDIAVAGAISLSVSALAAAGLDKWSRIPIRYMILCVFLGLAGLVLGNRFKLDLRWPDVVQGVDIAGCEVMVMAGAEPGVQVRLEGYGAPLTNLQLYVDNQNVVRLWRGGIYHSLRCRAEWVQTGADVSNTVQP